MRRLATAGAGLLLALALLELGLRVPGWLPGPSTRTDSFNILALGESTTQGGYLPLDQYPAQLERVLGRGCPKVAFRVVNGGIAGARAADILEALPGWVERAKPRLALTMIGINDLLGEKNPGNQVSDSPWRLLRAARWLSESLRSENSLEGFEYFRRVSQPLLNAGDAVTAEKRHRETLAKNPLHRQALLDLARALLLQKRFVEAQAEFARASALGGDAEPGLGELAALEGEGDQDAMLAKAKELLARADLTLSQVLLVQEALERTKRLKAMDEVVAASGGKSKELWNQARELRMRGTAVQWPLPLVKTYREIVTTLEGKGIKVYSFNYPRQSPAPVRLFAPNVIDLEGPFNEAVKREGYKELFYDSFGGNFGHLTQRGNWLLASVVGERLLSEEPLRSECAGQK